jgi:hypothetical protein
LRAVTASSIRRRGRPHSLGLASEPGLVLDTRAMAVRGEQPRKSLRCDAMRVSSVVASAWMELLDNSIL